MSHSPSPRSPGPRSLSPDSRRQQRMTKADAVIKQLRV